MAKRAQTPCKQTNAQKVPGAKQAHCWQTPPAVRLLLSLNSSGTKALIAGYLLCSLMYAFAGQSSSISCCKHQTVPSHS